MSPNPHPNTTSPNPPPNMPRNPKRPNNCPNMARQSPHWWRDRQRRTDWHGKPSDWRWRQLTFSVLCQLPKNNLWSSAPFTEPPTTNSPITRPGWYQDWTISIMRPFPISDTASGAWGMEPPTFRRWCSSWLPKKLLPISWWSLSTGELKKLRQAFTSMVLKKLSWPANRKMRLLNSHQPPKNPNPHCFRSENSDPAHEEDCPNPHQKRLKESLLPFRLDCLAAPYLPSADVPVLTTWGKLATSRRRPIFPGNQSLPLSPPSHFWLHWIACTSSQSSAPPMLELWRYCRNGTSPEVWQPRKCTSSSTPRPSIILRTKRCTSSWLLLDSSKWWTSIERRTCSEGIIVPMIV